LTASTSPGASSASVLGGPPVLAVATVGHRAWVLQPHYLNILDNLTVVVRTAAIADNVLTPDIRARLLLDPDGSTLWIVLEGVRHSRVLTLDAYNLTTRASMEFPDISSAATLDGHLYLVSDGSLVDLPPSGVPHALDTPTGLDRIAADPDRSRLLLLGGGFPTTVWTYQPGTNGATSRLTLPIAKASIAVVHGNVWVGGFGNQDPMLVRLNAAVSDSIGTSALANELGAGAVIVASGQRVFWARGGSDDLWCVDADTGKATQHWNIPGPVASVLGSAIVGSGGQLVSLHLTGCAG
jgi:outer membrane protein assembly factor BamB